MRVTSYAVIALLSTATALSVASPATGQLTERDEIVELFRSLQKKLANEKSSPEQRRNALEALGAAGRMLTSSMEIVQKQTWKDADEKSRLSAVAAMHEIGMAGRMVTAPLIDALRDPAIEVRAKAAERLALIYEHGHPPKGVVEALERQLNEDDNQYVRQRCCAALGIIGPEAKDAIPSVVKALKDTSNRPLRPSAAIAIADMGPAARKVEPILFHISKHELGDDSDLDGAVFFALYRIGAPADVMVPFLLKILEDCNGETLEAFGAKTIASMANPTGQGSLLAACAIARRAHNRPRLRATAAGVLGCYPREAIIAVPALIRALDIGEVFNGDEAREMRCACFGALGSIGPPAHSAVPLLRRIANDSTIDSNIRRNAQRAINEIQR